MFLKILFIFREREDGREKERERTSICGYLSSTPYQGPGPQPRHVSWLGIEPGTLRFSGQRSIHWATPARTISEFLTMTGHCNKVQSNLPTFLEYTSDCTIFISEQLYWCKFSIHLKVSFSCDGDKLLSTDFLPLTWPNLGWGLQWRWWFKCLWVGMEGTSPQEFRPSAVHMSPSAGHWTRVKNIPWKRSWKTFFLTATKLAFNSRLDIKLNFLSLNYNINGIRILLFVIPESVYHMTLTMADMYIKIHSLSLLYGNTVFKNKLNKN